jgi:hypothetical protein
MPKRSAAETAKFLQLARERFAQGQEATAKQRQRELDDLAFYAGGEHQWSKETLKARQAQQGDGNLPPIPARPCITINKMREPVHQVLNSERQSEMGISLVPADDWGELAPPISEEEIDLREGLVRRIQRESEAADARTWAFSRAAIAGCGYYRVMTRYAPGKTQDKDAYVMRIYNQASVTIDPAHEQPDGSDSEWGFIASDLAWERYKREYPKQAKGGPNQIVAMDDSAFRGLGDEFPGWFTDSGETKSVRVVEYFYTETTLRRLVQLKDGRSEWEDELGDGFELDVAEDDDGNPITREVPQKTIKWAKIDATQVLEETDWEGPDMPIIKVLGEELQPFDTERRTEGMVRPARGAQEGYNAMISKWVESVGYAPLSPLQVEETNIAAYGNWYNLLNTRALPFVPYRKYDDQGREIDQPTRVNAETPIQAIAASVQMFDEGIKSTTMVPSVQLGHSTDAAIKSGKAIDSLKQQGELGTSHLLDNLKRSIRYEGQILNNLLYPIYGRPGRLVRMLTGEGDPQTGRIGPVNGNGAAAPGGSPYAQPGQQIPAGAPMAGGGMGASSGGQPPIPPMGAQSQPGAPPASPKAPKVYTLTKDANFNVMVKVTRSFDSRRTEEATTIGNLLQAQPQLMAVFGDLFFKNQDGPGHEEMAERAEVMLDPKILAFRASKDQGTPVPPEATAQITQMKQQLDEAHGILQKAQLELKDRGEQHKAEQDNKLQIAQLEIASKEKIAAMDREAKLAVAELGAKIDRLTLFLEERGRIGAQLTDHAHEATQSELDRQHELNKGQLGHQNALEANAAGHAQNLDEASHSAALQPAPDPETTA